MKLLGGDFDEVRGKDLKAFNEEVGLLLLSCHSLIWFFLMVYPDVIPFAFIKLEEVFAALVLSTRQETVPVPLSEWLEYASRVTKNIQMLSFSPVQRNYHSGI